MTSYFPSTKPLVHSADSYKKQVAPKTVRTVIEGITQKLRGDTVKIIWIPKQHYELDPSEYISVFLLNEICLLVQDNKEGKDLKTLCLNALDHFPSEMWRKALKWTEKCEKIYMEDDRVSAEYEDENNSVEDENQIKIEEHSNHKAESP